MRVLLIYPNLDCPPGVNHGLAAISGVLKASGHETRLINVCDKLGPVPTTEEILAVVREWRPGLIGFSAMSQQFDWSCATARALREEFEIPLVIGGVHCTMVPDDVVATALFDYVAVGEAEYAMLELVDRLARREDTSSVPNMRIWRPASEGGPIRNAVMPFPDLTTLPPLDYDIWDLEKMIQVKNGWMGLITSRGCPYKCTYCFNKEIVDLYREEGGIKKTNEYLRTFPVGRIIDEIRMLQRRHPQISTLIFDDDLFTLDKEYVREFCTAYREASIGLPFVVNAHVQRFDHEMAGLLKTAGCMIVKYGLESGSDRVRREILWRYMTNDAIKKSFQAAHDFDLHSSAFIMFGLPTETRQEIEETLELCAQIKMGRFRWAIFYPFPGTAGYTIADKMGLIDFDKMKGLGNYFDGSCLKLGDEMDLYVEKLGALCNWFVNARTDWPSAPLYRKLAAEVDAMDREEFRRRRHELVAYDKTLSERLAEDNIQHYTIRFAHVMGVRSDFLKRERERGRVKKSNEWSLAYSNYTLD
ncbi:MAG: radical SAM protein [Planctomycetota bacterium]